MTKQVGTYSLADLLLQKYTPASQFGFDAIARAIQAHLNWLNGQVTDQMGLIAESSNDVRRIFGGSENMAMAEVDEFGTARTQKDTSGYEVDFPLRKFSISTGWTSSFINRATPADLARKALDVSSAYITRLRQELAAALFNKTNYNFVDWLGDGTTLAIYRLLNADSKAIPNAPDGTAFTAATHNHYMGTAGAALAYTDVDLLISNVTEHMLGGVKLFINAANVSTLTNLASTKFVALTLAVVAVPGATSGTVVKANVDDDLANKLVGYWAGYEVYTRSWVPSGFYLCVATGSPQKPLVHRLDRFDNLNGLSMVYELNAHPLTAQVFEAEIGFGAWGRHAAAVLDGGAQTTYAAPSGLIR